MVKIISVTIVIVLALLAVAWKNKIAGEVDEERCIAKQGVYFTGRTKSVCIDRSALIDLKES